MRHSVVPTIGEAIVPLAPRRAVQRTLRSQIVSAIPALLFLFNPAVLSAADIPMVFWGANTDGQASVASVPATASDAIAIAAGRHHNIALKADGTVVGWVYDVNGQSTVPVGLNNVIAIATGYDHNLALKNDGTVVAWGRNDLGQATVPGGLSGVVAVSASGDRSMALKNDGSVVSWGVAAGTPPPGLQAIAIAAGIGHSLALRSDSTVVAWGVNNQGEANVPLGLTNVIAIAAGSQFSMALREDGSVVAWGDNTFGAATVPPAAASGVRAIAAGYGQALAIKTDGTVVAWGYNGMGEANVPVGLTGVRAVAGGYDHSMALTGDQPLASLIVGQPVSQIARQGATVRFHVGTLGSPAVTYQWKKNGVDLSGQTGPTLLLTDVHSAANGSYSVAVNNTHGPATSAAATLTVSSVVIWGGNTFGQTAFSSMPLSTVDAVAIAAGGGHNAAAKANGSLVGWGLNHEGQGIPPVVANAVAVAAGYDHSVALRSDGTVVAWGRNADGESTVPGGLTDVVAISANARHNLALKRDGTVVPWGSALPGQPGLVGAVAIACGVSHNLAVKNDGTVVSWGSISTVPGGLNNVRAVAAGNDFSVALKWDGTVVAWGLNDEGQATVPGGLTDVVAVAAGFAHALALRANGTVVAWGRNGGGQSTVPATLTEAWAISAGFEQSAALAGSFSIPPMIAGAPVSQSIDVGGTIRFQVQIIAYAPVTYQWRRNGVDLDGETSSSLLLSAVDGDDAGIYTVVVTSAFGSVTSSAATLTVMANPPAITQQPVSIRVRPGASANLSVTATGPLLTYQWRKNGVPIPGQTASTLLFTSALVSDSATYSVMVSNPSGDEESDEAILTVLPVVPFGGNSFGLNQALLSEVPVSVFNAVAVAAGGGHNVALKADGTVVAWVYNSAGQSTVPPGLSGVVAVAAGYDHNLALKSDGTVVAWGRQNHFQSIVPGDLGFVTAVSANEYRSLVLQNDGTLRTWGNTEGGLLSIPPGLTGVVGISAGVKHNLAVLSDGTVTAWGQNNAGETNVPAELTDVIAVAGGKNFSLALKNDGTVVAWGDNSVGQTTVPPQATGVTAIAAGDSHALALRSDGMVVGWGLNAGGRASPPSGLPGVVAISAGFEHSLILVAQATTLTVEGITAANKVYDGTTTAQTAVSSATLVGVIDGDDVTLQTSGVSGTFANKTVGTGKTVTITGLTLSGADANKYILTPPTATADITAADLTMDGITAAHKVYDAATGASLNTGAAALQGLVLGDVVTFDASGATGAFADKNVGTDKSVNITGVDVSGADSGNYLFTQPTTTANITAAGLTVTGITANGKVYDGNTGATLNTGAGTLQGVLPGDTVALNASGATGTFADKNVGSGKLVTIAGLGLSGTESGNYLLTQPTATATISAAGLTVGGITANNKVYNGNTVATLNTGAAAFQGLAPGDAVTFNAAGATGTFANKNVGTTKPVSIVGVTVSGADSGNYLFSQPATTANITTAALTVTGITATDKVYDGNTTATLNTGAAALQGLVSGDAVTLNTGGAAGTFANKNVGTSKAVSVAGLALSGADSGNYVVTQPGTTASITAAGLTVSGITASNKVYNRNTAATLNTGAAALQGLVSGDVVTLNSAGATGSFADKNVGAGKTVTIVGLAITGAGSGNYLLAQPAATASITAAGLTVTGITANNKPYDGTTAATLITAGANLVAVLAGDSVTLVTAVAVGTFADANAGVDKTVFVSGLTLAGADAGNYALTQPTTAATISSAALTVTGITASDKVYDATTTATLNTAEAILLGVVPSDNVTLSVAGAVGTFADKDAALDKTVQVSGLTLTGPDAAKYTLVQPTTTADVTAAGLTVAGLTVVPKVYDGTITASLNTSGAALVGVLEDDEVVLSVSAALASFASETVGNGKAVSITGLTIDGEGAGNYLLTQPAATGNITPRGLTVTGVTAATKVYDANTSATLQTQAAALQGLVAGDIVTLNTSGATGAFADKNVGTAKPVVIAGVAISGTDAANYALIQPGSTANITALGMTVNGITANNKVYDGGTIATLNTAGGALQGLLAGDLVTVNAGAATGAFADKNVGTGKAVNVAGLALAGIDSGNYALTQPSTTANITAAGLTVNGITANNKVYDGNTAATLNTVAAALQGLVAGDVVTLNAAGATGIFADENVGTAKPVAIVGVVISGIDSGNYALTQPGATANITAHALTVTGITADNKVYDGNTAATLNTGLAALQGLVSGDVVTLNADAATGAFADKNVGTGKTVMIAGLALSGVDSGNYAVTQPTATANITAQALTVTGVIANHKVYDGNTAATLDAGGAVLQGLLSGDLVTVDASGATGTFADEHIGTAKTVTITGLALSGTDGANYLVTQPGATADITARALTVTGITASNKVYDGTTGATLNTGAAALQGLVSGDVVALNAAAAAGTFGDKNVGTAKPVSIAGLTISGADVGNYALTQPSATANITASGLTVTGVTANNKVYDGNTTATLDTGAGALQGLMAGDVVTLNDTAATGAFANKNIGTAKLVTIAGLAIAGTDAGNYALTQPSTTADITAANLTVTGIIANNKVYNGSAAAALNTSGAALQGVVAGDAVSLNANGATGTFPDKNAGIAKTVTIIGVVISGASSGNYTLTQPIVTADIAKAPLIVRADDKARLFGQANPTLTITYSGFITGEGVGDLDSQATLSTTATADSAVGQYPITLSGGSDNNYAYTLLHGTLFVEAALLNLSARLLEGTPGHFQLTTVGEPNRLYRVQVSENLTVWEEIGTVLAESDGLLVFTDTSAAQAHRYYRLQAD